MSEFLTSIIPPPETPLTPMLRHEIAHATGQLLVFKDLEQAMVAATRMLQEALTFWFDTVCPPADRVVLQRWGGLKQVQRCRMHVANGNLACCPAQNREHMREVAHVTLPFTGNVPLALIDTFPHLEDTFSLCRAGSLLGWHIVGTLAPNVKQVIQARQAHDDALNQATARIAELIEAANTIGDIQAGWTYTPPFSAVLQAVSTSPFLCMAKG